MPQKTSSKMQYYFFVAQIYNLNFNKKQNLLIKLSKN